MEITKPPRLRSFLFETWTYDLGLLQPQIMQQQGDMERVKREAYLVELCCSDPFERKKLPPKTTSGAHVSNQWFGTELCDCNNVASGCGVWDPAVLCYPALFLFHFVMALVPFVTKSKHPKETTPKWNTPVTMLMRKGERDEKEKGFIFVPSPPPGIATAFPPIVHLC